MKRILFIPSPTLPFPPVNGGAVQNLLNFIVESNEKQKQFNIEITSVFNEEAGDVSNNYVNCKVHHIRVPNLFIQLRDKQIRYLSGRFSRLIESAYLKGIKKILLLNKYDMVIFENTHQYAYILRNYLKDTYSVLHLHNDYLNEKVHNANLYASSYNEIVCISKYIEKKVLSIGNIRTTVIYNGIDTLNFKRNPYARKQIRDKFNIDNDAKVILFSGRIVKEKGVLELIKAFNNIDADLNIVLMIIGSKIYGKTIKDKYANFLEDNVKSSKKPIIFTGYIDYGEIVNYYSACDIGILPTLWEEPLSLSVIEYMSMGMPVVVSNSGGMVELIDNSYGFVVKKENEFIENLAKTIELLSRDEKEFNYYSELSAIRANQFDKELYCKAMWDFIKSRI